MEYWVGNDIVDLLDCKTDFRFMQRVCTSEELAKPERIWILWAIKEASYKVLKKIDPDILFIPKHFIVAHDLKQCRYQDYITYTAVTVVEDYIHAIATFSPRDFPITTAIQKTIGNESDFVRAMAQNILEEKGYPDCKILKIPPRIYQYGKQCKTLDISLSHDGRFSATVIGNLN